MNHGNESPGSIALQKAAISRRTVAHRDGGQLFLRYNRWDILLQEWFDKKTDAERKQMQNMRRKRIGDRIISRKEQIKPRYQLENEDILLCLPSMGG
jgi:methionyl-tRNA synthetase